MQEQKAALAKQLAVVEAERKNLAAAQTCQQSLIDAEIRKGVKNQAAALKASILAEVEEEKGAAMASLEQEVKQKSKKLKEFNKARSEIMDISGHTVAEDDDWNEYVTVKLEANTELANAQRQVVAEDYGMTSGMLTLNTRGPLVHYALQQLRVEPNSADMSARSQPIVVANRSEIDRWLFD